MITNLETILSDSAKGMKRSVIRELLKLTQKPEIISFAGGLPAPNSFPIEELKQITNEVLEEDGKAALQYGATEGDTRLREILTERYKNQGLNITTDNLVILTSSQQGLDLVAKIFINRGDKIICGLPSYLGGWEHLQVMEPFLLASDSMNTECVPICLKQLFQKCSWKERCLNSFTSFLIFKILPGLPCLNSDDLKLLKLQKNTMS